jgi:hypothetical protein
MSDDVLTIVVPGRVASNNALPRGPANRTASGRRALEYKEHAHWCVVEAANAVRWNIPQCARVTITIFQTWIDADNGTKLGVDSLKGIAIIDDNRDHMRFISAEHAMDDGEPRIEITVTACEPLTFPNPRRAPRLRRDTRIPKEAPDIHAAFAEAQAEARRRVPRSIDDMKNGETVSFADIPAILQRGGVSPRKAR